MTNMVDIKNRIKAYEEGVRALNKEFKLNPVVSIEFPQYKKLPLLLTWALKIIGKHKGVFMLSYKEE